MKYRVVADNWYVPDLGIVEYLVSGDALRSDIVRFAKVCDAFDVAVNLRTFEFEDIYTEVANAIAKKVDIDNMSDAATLIDQKTINFIRSLRKESRKWRFSQSIDICDSGEVYADAGMFTDVVLAKSSGLDLRAMIFKAISDDFIDGISRCIYRSFKDSCRLVVTNLDYETCVAEVKIKPGNLGHSYYTMALEFDSGN